MGGLLHLHLVQRGGDLAGPQSAQVHGVTNQLVALGHIKTGAPPL